MLIAAGLLAKHMITASSVCIAAFAMFAFAVKRYRGPVSIGKHAVVTAVIIGLCAAVSLSSNTTIVPCEFDSTRDCTYNDGVPMVSMIVGIFVLVSLVRSWLVYSER